MARIADSNERRSTTGLRRAHGVTTAGLLVRRAMAREYSDPRQAAVMAPAREHRRRSRASAPSPAPSIRKGQSPPCSDLAVNQGPTGRTGWGRSATAGLVWRRRCGATEEVPNAGGEWMCRFELDEVRLRGCDFLSRFQLARLRGPCMVHKLSLARGLMHLTNQA